MTRSNSGSGHRLAAKVSPEELSDLFQKKVESEFATEDVGLCLIVENIGKIHQDLSKVEFDFENSYYRESDNWDSHRFGPRQIGDLSFIFCQAGGDWEYPVSFIIYLDKDGKTFRGYIPKMGNPYNHDTKSAFGNDEEADDRFLAKWTRKNRLDCENPDPDIMHDPVAFEADIVNRIQVFTEK